MTSETIQEVLSREPFEAFRIRTSDGHHYDVLNPHLVAMTKSRLYVAIPASDRGVIVSYLHITAIETIENGHKKPRRRGGRGKR